MSTAHIALNRFGYGLRRGESVPANSVRYLLTQMDRFDPAPQAIAGREDYTDKPGEILQMLRRLRQERQRAAAGAMAAMADMPERAGAANGLPEEFVQAYMRAGQALRADIGLRTNLAVASPTPFIERLVHFWSNHFSVTAQKPGTHYMVANHEFGAIRPHVLGKFSDMLKAAVLHPAMLLYLDQFQSVGPNSQFMQLRRRRQTQGGPQGLNENLAREILELHTLGVGGGYSQADVTEFARALTGWTVDGLSRAARFSESKGAGAAWVGIAHEPGQRQMLGRSYRDSGAQQAVEIIEDLASAVPMRRLLSGDVGSGKTVVFLTCAAAMVESGHRVAIMVPSDALVHQTVATCAKHLPHLSVAVVSGDRCDDWQQAALVVGTTALVARAPEAFDLVICDEQHKFSRPQREAILADRAHLLEVSATAIPRTQALVELGLTQCTQLHGCPVPKRIATRIWTNDSRRALFGEIHAAIARGEQIIVVYPGRRAAEDAGDAVKEREAGRRVYSVADFVDSWIDAFGAKVRCCHGGLSSEANRQALDDMHTGKAQILVATTLIEVGVDLPSVRRAVVVQADRFGLSQLHQIRGRVARGGGEGHCDLFLPLDVSAEAMDRLQVLVDHTDGFVVASADCAQRGSGDITQGGVRQKGAMPKSPFTGREVSHGALEQAAAALHQACSH